MVLLILLGCPRPKPPDLEDRRTDAEEREARAVVEGPVTWIMDGHPDLCLPVPEGWSGTTGPAPLVLDVTSADGVRVTLSVSAEGFPPEREGFELLFEDEGSYRAIPLLTGGGTRSWQSVDPTGPLVQAWYGTVREEVVEAAVTFPLGTSTGAGDQVRAMLRGLCVAD